VVVVAAAVYTPAVVVDVVLGLHLELPCRQSISMATSTFADILRCSKLVCSVDGSKELCTHVDKVQIVTNLISV